MPGGHRQHPTGRVPAGPGQEPRIDQRRQHPGHASPSTATPMVASGTIDPGSAGSAADPITDGAVTSASPRPREGWGHVDRGPQPAGIGMQIYLRRQQRCMPQQVGDLVQTAARIGEVAGKRMSQLVRPHRRRNPRPASGRGDQGVDRIRRHRSPDRLAEQVDEHEIVVRGPRNSETFELVGIKSPHRQEIQRNQLNRCVPVRPARVLPTLDGTADVVKGDWLRPWAARRRRVRRRSRCRGLGPGRVGVWC